MQMLWSPDMQMSCVWVECTRPWREGLALQLWAPTLWVGAL